MTLFVYQIQGCFSWKSQDVMTWYHHPICHTRIPHTIFDCAVIRRSGELLNLIQGSASEIWQSREQRRKKNKDWDEAKQLNCQGADLTPPRNFGDNLLRVLSVWTNWFQFLYLQKESAKRDSENKQSFKYQMTHLMEDILSSHIQSVCHMVRLSIEDNNRAI